METLFLYNAENLTPTTVSLHATEMLWEVERRQFKFEPTLISVSYQYPRPQSHTGFVHLELPSVIRAVFQVGTGVG